MGRSKRWFIHAVRSDHGTALPLSIAVKYPDNEKGCES